MARVLVTGSTGLLGSSLLPALADGGHEVLRLRHGDARVGQDEFSADLSEYAALAPAVAAAAPEIIVNLAALTNVDECERDPIAAYTSNTRIVENLARWIESSAPAVHLIQVSTDQLYEGTGPHSEEHVRPVNYYAFSKLGGELAALRVDATVLRTNLFGRSRAPGRASLSDWLVAVMTRREPARVFDDVLFSPLSLDSLARYLELAVRRRISGVFNLGSRGGMSKAEFAFRLARTLGMRTDLLTRTVSTTANFAARRPLDMRMQCSRFEREFAVTLPTFDSEIESMRQVYDHAA
jgi:dTDP-4-dehydrorhamnose reductase